MFVFQDDLTQEITTALPKEAGFSATPFSSGAPNLEDRKAWQQHTMTLLYKHSFDPDPKISLQALDKIAKTSVAGLTEDRVTVNLNSKSMDEVKHLLFDKVATILSREEKVISEQ